MIVPTYNESDNIVELTERLFAAAGDSVDLMIVDDNSEDGTAELVKVLKAKRRNVHLIERTSKLGLGTAYVAGFAWGLKRDYWAMVEMDADLSHDPAYVPRLLAALDDADVAIGSRYVPGGSVQNWGRFRRMLSRYANTYARLWLRHSVSDSTAGFRAFRATSLRGVDLDTLHSEGYAFQIEMIRRIDSAGGRITEVPITFVERAHGKSKMTMGIIAEALVYVTISGGKDRLARVSPYLFSRGKRRSRRG